MQRPATSTYKADGVWCSTLTGPSGAVRRCSATRAGALTGSASGGLRGTTLPDAIGRGYIWPL